jgi:cytochrome c6
MRNRTLLAALTGAVALLAVGQAQAATPGEQTYLDNCAACHQPTGVGVKGAFPSLKGDHFVVGPKPAVIATVLHGRGGMPAWKSELTDAQVAGVISYVRSAWGNKAPAVTPAEVAKVRSNTKAAPISKGLQMH